MSVNDCCQWQDRCHPPQSPACIITIIISVLHLISLHRLAWWKALVVPKCYTKLMWWSDFLSVYYLPLLHWDGSRECVCVCSFACILAYWPASHMCVCVYVWTRQMMENKSKMRCIFFPVRVCLVNLFRLFSLLQTHANEIEWEWMTSIQAQTDSLISFPLSFSPTLLC